MNPERLLAHFERLADAPDAIPRLRRFVLDLAVRGKLVEQDPNDEPTAHLLKRRKVPSGLHGPFDIPRRWGWVNVGSVAGTRLGKMLDRSKNRGTPHPYLRNINVRWFDFDLSDLLEMRFEDFELDEFELRRGDVLICEGGEPGRAAVWDACESGIYFQKALHRVRFLEVVDAHYFVNALRASADDGRLTAYFTGTGIKHFTGRSLDAYLFPLPPLAEQHRIVAKINELMALCDRLEAARNERESRRDRLVVASLHRLSQPVEEDGADAFRANARFYFNHLPRLTTHPDHIKQLRQTILNLAVRGRLVPQDPTDEPASTFDRALPAHVEPPCDIPTSWKWARLHTLGKLKGGGTPSKARDDYWNGDIPWVSPKDMKVDYVVETQMSISESAIAGSAANLIEAGSVLFVVRGMILAHSFPVAVTRVPLAINQDMKALELKNPEMAEYLLRALKGLKPEVLKKVRRSSHGTCRLEGSDYSDLLIPIPRVAEQGRIVAKVDELMVICDRLEARLAETEADSRRLLEAVLHEAVAPAADHTLGAVA